MIAAAIYTCKNEVDIVEASFRHMLAEGIDRIYTTDHCSTDGTSKVLAALSRKLPITVIRDEGSIHHQPEWMNVLAHIAALNGAEWIVASDIDEFWYAIDGRPLAEVLAGCTEDKLMARTFQHTDWNNHHIDAKPMCKVAYRWRADAELFIGNHDVSIDGGSEGVIAIRELQYRSFEHFCSKIETFLETFDPIAEAHGAGGHHTKFRGADEETLRRGYDEILAEPSINDPIPSRSKVRPW